MEENITQLGNKVMRGRALMELLDHFSWTPGHRRKLTLTRTRRVRASVCTGPRG